jgi:hypothetical protein
VNVNYRFSLGTASLICAEIKQRVSIPWLWRYHNLPGEPKPGGRSHSPFYPDKKPDFCISRDGSWFKDVDKVLTALTRNEVKAIGT